MRLPRNIWLCASTVSKTYQVAYTLPQLFYAANELAFGFGYPFPGSLRVGDHCILEISSINISWVTNLTVLQKCDILVSFVIFTQDLIESSDFVKSYLFGEV